jgi:hypothetical protein
VSQAKFCVYVSRATNSEPTNIWDVILNGPNQHRVLPIGRLKGVTVDLDGVTLRHILK